MDTELIKRLLEAGAHFGHSRSRCNPKMKPFVFGERSKIYIIDLEKTVEYLNKAREFLKDIVSKGGKVLLVGTKKQAQDVIFEAAQRSGMFYVTNRWLGGTLTNFKTIRNSINRFKEIETMKQDGTFEAITKKERAILTKEMEKLKKNLQGIVEMKKMPEAIFIVDAKKEDIAVKEARKLLIPIVAIVDTNASPDIIDYPIPANDDAMRSIKLIVEFLTESMIEGQSQFEESSDSKEIIQHQEKPEKPEDPAEEKQEVVERADEIAEQIKIEGLKEKEEKRVPSPKKKGYRPNV